MILVISDVIKDINTIQEVLKTTTNDIVITSHIESYDEIAVMTTMNKIDMCDKIYFAVSSLYNRTIDFMRLYARKTGKEVVII